MAATPQAPSDYQDVDVRVEYAKDLEQAVPLKQLEDAIKQVVPKSLDRCEDTDLTVTNSIAGAAQRAPKDGDLLHLNTTTNKWEPVDIAELTKRDVDIFELQGVTQSGSVSAGQFLAIEQIAADGTVIWANVDAPSNTTDKQVIKNAADLLQVKPVLDQLANEKLEHRYFRAVKGNTVDNVADVVGVDFNNIASHAQHKGITESCKIRFHVVAKSTHGPSLEMWIGQECLTNLGYFTGKQNPQGSAEVVQVDTVGNVQNAWTRHGMSTSKIHVSDRAFGLTESGIQVKQDSLITGELFITRNHKTINVQAELRYQKEADGKLHVVMTSAVIANPQSVGPDKIIIVQDQAAGSASSGNHATGGSFITGAFEIIWS